MIKGTLIDRNNTTSVNDKLGKHAELDKILMEFRESSRRLEKVRSLLHLGDIEVGASPHEILEETRTYKLLHYYPLVARAARTPILVVYALD